MAHISTQRLNELLVEVLEELNERGSWTSMDGTRFTDHDGLLTVEYVEPRPVYPPEPTVDELLEDGLVPLWNPTGWDPWGKTLMGKTLMVNASARRGGARLAKPYEGDPQPSYDFECYQCGRPITDRNGVWKDHAGRTGCDAALLAQDVIDSDDYWLEHQPKPFEGEEEDDESTVEDCGSERSEEE